MSSATIGYRYYASEGVVMRRKGDEWPAEVYGSGRWKPYSDMWDFMHTAMPISEAEAHEMMAEDDKIRS